MVYSGNGSDAIFIALRALNISPDEVIVPKLTFIATWLGAGAKVAKVDVEDDELL